MNQAFERKGWVMPIDWDSIDDAIDKAGKRTDDALASRIAAITRLTNEEVKKLFPKPADVEKLTELIQIVQSSANDRARANQLVKNIGSLAGTAIKLLGKIL